MIKFFIICALIAFISIEASRDAKDLLPKTCGKPYGTRLFGGIETEIGEYPWTALLEYTSKSGKPIISCHATLISSRYVLSAAHCVSGAIVKLVGPLRNVILGEHDLSNSDVDCMEGLFDEVCADKIVVIPVEKYSYHTNYNSSSTSIHNDIALIRMERDAPFTDFISPICLPLAQNTWTEHTKFVTSGWGTDLDNKKVDIKRRFFVRYVDTKTCEDAYKRNSLQFKIHKSQLCAGGGKNKDLCKGTGGAPLMQLKDRGYELEGIVSFGWAQCGAEGKPVVYTNVASFRDWIEQEMEP